MSALFSYYIQELEYVKKTFALFASYIMSFFSKTISQFRYVENETVCVVIGNQSRRMLRDGRLLV